MVRLFCDLTFICSQQIVLPADVVKHIFVRRLSVGDSVCLFNGSGGEYIAKLIKLDKRETIVEITEFKDINIELTYQVMIAQGLPEVGKMDWIVEKAVEIGVSKIFPIAAERSVVKLSEERALKRKDRWQSIITSASEQCGRNKLMTIESPSTLQKCIERNNHVKQIMFSPRAQQSLSQWARNKEPSDVLIWIGPEGGFSEQEEKFAQSNGVIFLSMGKRILRTETAGIAAVSALNALWEGM